MSRSAFESLLVERAGRQEYPYPASDALLANILDGVIQDPPYVLLRLTGGCSTMESVGGARRSWPTSAEGGVCYGMLQVYCSSFRSLVSHDIPIGGHAKIGGHRVRHWSMF
jgi:hypothetical protein